MTAHIRVDELFDSVLYYRDPFVCLKDLFRNPEFLKNMKFAPERLYTREGSRMYTELNSGDWIWELQVSEFICALQTSNTHASLSDATP